MNSKLKLAGPYCWCKGYIDIAGYFLLDQRIGPATIAGCFLMNCKQKLAGHAPAGLRDHKGHSPIGEVLVMG